MPSRTVVVAAPHENVRRVLAKTDLFEGAAVRVDRVAVEVSATAEDKTTIEIQTERFSLPFFGWALNGLLRKNQTRALGDSIDKLKADLEGGTSPPARKRPGWAPPESLSVSQATTIATVGLAIAACGYSGSLLTQAIDPVAETFNAGNVAIGFLTGFARFGALIALSGAFLADKIGRRRLLLVSIALAATASLLSAFAFDIRVFAALQVITRGAANLAGVVGFIIVVEEAPDGARAWALSIVSILGALGFVLGGALFPIVDIAPNAWRVLYGIGGLAILLVRPISRHLRETARFAQLAARTKELGHVSEIAGRTYGKRFLLVAILGFFLNVFFAPASQYTNRFLADERGMSATAITILRAITQTLPALAGALIGGRLAERAGRKPSAFFGVVIGAVATAMFFSSDGLLLAAALLISTTAVAVAGPGLAAFNTELFPTEVRGTAGGSLLVAAVIGSAAGLIFASQIASMVGGLGNATAITCASGLIAALLLLKLPEAKGSTLEKVSPSEV